MVDMSDTPAPRIGDVERDQALAWLREHLEAGRLDAGEFEERMASALQARTMADLTPLFVDLPAPGYGDGQQQWPLVPGTATPAAASDVVPASTTGTEVAEVRSPAAKALSVVSAAAWPAIIIVNFAFGWHLWWLFLIPVFLLPALWGQVNQSRGGQH